MASALLNSENKRTSWKISLGALQVLKGAQEKLAYHTSRLQVWEKAREDVKAKILSGGVVIDESVLEGTSGSTYSNSGRNPSVSVNAELIRDLNETNTKITEHKDKVASFQSWVEFLENASGLLDLTLSDYLYFFGKK